MMAQSFNDYKQGVIAINVDNQPSETQVELKDSKGSTIVSHKPELDFAVVIILTPELAKGEKYSVTVSSETSEFEAS